jgi:very-short-patch-repair endonuclease
VTWRRFADPNTDYSVSAAEISLACKLAEANCLRFETQKQFCLQSTKPDFYFADVNLAVYLDGEQVHRNREQKDQELRDKLEERYGCTVRSYSYRAPITKARLQEICDKIVDDVTGLRRMRR